MVAPNRSDAFSALEAAGGKSEGTGRSKTTDPAKTTAAEAAAAGGDARGGVSERKRRANRRNARKSTGPRTPEGKARASRNATTHGIFCRDLVLVGEDPGQFEFTRDGFLDALKPQDAAQLALVDGAVSARWRLNRCQFAEAALIEQRIAATQARVKEKFETFKRVLRVDDFSAAALAAQCEESDLFRRHYQRWQSLRACEKAAMHPGHALAALVQDQDADRASLERLSRYEHRLEQSFHRCLRDLHVLKQKAEQYADEPASPFRTARHVADDEDHTPSPQPSPRSTEAREQEADAPVQNEPTADESAASDGTAESCEDDADATPASAPPDPNEMAELRKLTERLSHCRPIDDDDSP